MCRVLPARSALRTAPEGSYPICLLKTSLPPRQPRRHSADMPQACRGSPVRHRGPLQGIAVIVQWAQSPVDRGFAGYLEWESGFPLIPTKDSEMREVISRSFRGLRSEPQPLDTGNWAFRGVFERALNTPPTLAGRQPDRPPASRGLCMLR